VNRCGDEHIATMKKPFTLLAFREARKKLEFVLPIDSSGHNNFRAAKGVAPEETRLRQKVRSSYPLKGGLIEFQLLRQPSSFAANLVKWAM
jgi:hypothetical protein